MLVIEPMSEKHARSILRWKYILPYDFYDNEESDEALTELLNESYCAVMDAKLGIVGFFCTGHSARVPFGENYGAYPDGWIDIGLGMKPELTGKGAGIQTVLSSIRADISMEPQRLTVASFNKRAIHLYKKFGFIETLHFPFDTSQFTVMVRQI